MTTRRSSILVMTGAMATLAVPAAAHAEPPPARPTAITIGSPLKNMDAATGCSIDSGCAVVHQRLGDVRRGGSAVKAPWRGVIVRWSVRGVGDFSLFPARYTSDDVIVRKPGTITRRATTPNTWTWNARTPIQEDEHIGLVAAKNARLSVRSNANADTDSWAPASPVGGPPTRAETPDVPAEVAYNAVIESDVDGDGFGDVTQDGCRTDRSTQGECPAPPPSPPPPPPPPPAPPADTTAPAFLSRPSVVPRRVRPRHGARLHIALSEPATTTIVIKRGRRTVSRITSQVSQGMSTIRIPRKLRSGGRHRWLRRGRYRVTIVAVDAAGNASPMKRLRFSVR